MRHWRPILSLLFVLTTTPLLAEVVDGVFFSELLQENRTAKVYLPPDYDPESGEEWPVVLFLHGAGATPSSYVAITGVLENGILAEALPSMVMVLPDGSAEPYAGSFYVNSDLYGEFEDHIITEVIPWLQGTYAVSSDPGQWAIMGHSMGGFGAMRFALLYPNLFAVVAAHSGPQSLAGIDYVLGEVLTENGGEAPYTYSPTAGNFSYLMFTLAGAFTPDLEQPFDVEFPLDSDGEVIDEVFDRWYPFFPGTLVRDQHNSLDDLAIYFDCGNADELGVFPMNTALVDSLDAFGIEHTFEEYNGDHSSLLAQRTQVGFTFIADHLDLPDNSTDERTISLPATAALTALYPNPFNASLSIRYTLPATGAVELSVWNSLGQQVALLERGTRAAGAHAAVWTPNGTAISSGTYFVRLESGSGAMVQRVQLVK
ncbi:T9SS type A sorting domain-containing protein [bacterium]|nr:T9SS type A sorting domain-containing protein [bacterium]